MKSWRSNFLVAVMQSIRSSFSTRSGRSGQVPQQQILQDKTQHMSRPKPNQQNLGRTTMCFGNCSPKAIRQAGMFPQDTVFHLDLGRASFLQTVLIFRFLHLTNAFNFKINLLLLAKFLPFQCKRLTEEGLSLSYLCTQNTQSKRRTRRFLYFLKVHKCTSVSLNQGLHHHY